MRSYKTEGIVIKRRNFGESDRILTLLTNSYGKIQAKAPGVRKITSRRSSHTELLNLTFLTLYKSPRSSLPIVIEAKASEEFLSIKNSLKKIGYAYYICELIDILCAQSQENRRVFFLARDTLFQLSNNIGNTSAIEYFEDELLVTLGFLPRTHKLIDKRNFIESIVEKKLRTRRLLPLFLDNR